ncbi:hypothetical protein D6827_00075 [Candidatus Parcubacteria bacterium]|nr:MAG: hypothetical protein D6827_00075 [Candidatus Parcubacteria bacterium]
MTRISIKIQGADKLLKLQKRVRERAEKAHNQAAARASYYLRNELQEYIKKSQPAGRVYKRYRPQRVVIASAPGQPPAIDLGSFIESINVKTSGFGHYSVGTDDPRGKWFEVGTPQMLPRPWFTPVLAAQRANLSKIIREEIDRVMRGE